MLCVVRGPWKTQLGFAFVSSFLLDIRILCEAHVRFASLRWDSSLFAFHHCLLWLFETFLDRLCDWDA